MEDNSMFRFLMKYVGKYRVLTELTLDTHDFVRDASGNVHEDYDELYIECNRNAKIKHTYKENILSYWTDKISIFKSTKKKLDENNIKYQSEEVGTDYLIYFDDTDMSKVAKLVGAKAVGKKIPPFNVKNIPDRVIVERQREHSEPAIISTYVIPFEDMKLYYSAVAPIRGRSEKMQLSKKTLAEFDKEIIKIKGVGINPAQERESKNISPREYIHSIGLWEEYIKYVKKAVEESFKCQKI